MPLKILRANEATCRRLPTCDESFADRVNVGDAPARADNAVTSVGFLEQTVLGHAKMVCQWFDCQTAPNYGKTLQNIWIGIPPIKTTFRDAHAIERHANGEADILRHIGAPDWLIRVMPTLKSIIGRARRLFRVT